MKNVFSPARIGAAFVVAPAVIVLAGGPALAADSVSVSNTETVQAHLDASGHVRDARVYEQLALQGHGTVTVSDPVSTRNLRNLDGFGGFDVKGANLVANVSVDGERRLRAVSDFTKELPLKVTATYTLDGKKVEPGDVVGRSGLLQVHYVVENVTGRDQEVSFDDGTGTKVTRTEKVVIPMVGSLTTVLPSTFTDVRSDEAAIAGDGHGGTKMTFTMTLFGPIGSPRAEFGYAARVTDGVVPAATVSALPVSPLDSPSFKGGAASYKGGADTGLELTSGATQIDSNVLKLRDGAAQLLAGLIKLRDGAKALNAGLSGKAAPGAAKLASGAGALKSGTGKLAKGAGDAKAGSTQLANGAAALSEGIDQITAGVDALPGDLAKDPDFQRLKGALSGIRAGIGTSSDMTSATLLGGLNLLKAGLRSPLGQAHCNQMPSSATDPTACGAADGAAIIADKLGTASANGGSIDQLLGAAVGAYDYIAATSGGTCAPRVTGGNPLALPPAASLMSANPGCKAAAAAAYGYGSGANPALGFPDGGLKAQSALAAAKLAAVAAGLDGPFKDGINAIAKGLSNPGCNPHQTNTHAADACGVADAAKLVSGGVDTLVGSIADQLGGALSQAGDGASQVAGGAKALDSGLGQLKSGAGQLDSGASQLQSGADQLSTGLGDAATGSGKLADGLDTAASKAPALEDGASRLSAEGTTKLVDAGKGTAADYGLKYALIEAGAQRAKAEGMAYGAPAGATGATAYSLELAGMTGEGSRNVGRGLGAVAVFGLGAGLTVLRRRWL